MAVIQTKIRFSVVDTSMLYYLERLFFASTKNLFQLLPQDITPKRDREATGLYTVVEGQMKKYDRIEISFIVPRRGNSGSIPHMMITTFL